MTIHTETTPVAWRWRWKDSASWIVQSGEPDALEGREIEPLFNEEHWKPISTCPYRTPVDLWCIYGGEEFARYDGGSPIGFLVSSRHRTEQYGFFGNQSNDGVPRREGPDLVPVAWRSAVPLCPSELIAEILNLPIDREAAIAADMARAG